MNNNLKDRILGCLLGGAIGDAIGSKYEGKKASRVVSWEPPWRISDDTQLTMATCEALIEDGHATPEGISATFLRWFDERKLIGLGAATRGALKALEQGGHWALVGRRGEMAAGNGAAMRAAPLAFVLNPTSDEGRLIIRDISRITHHSDEAYSGALAMVLAVHFTTTECWTGSDNLISMICEHLPDTLVRERLRILNEARYDHPINELAGVYGCSGFVAESVPLALVAAQDVKTFGFKIMQEELVKCGGDTDTNASMAGQVAGCLLGSAGLNVEQPPDWPVAKKLESLTSTVFKLCRPKN